MVSPAHPSSRKRLIATFITLCLALGLVGYGAWGVWQWYQTTYAANPTIPTQTVTRSTDEPDETPIDEVCEEYTVADNRPRKLLIDRLSIDSCIQPVGIDQSDAVAVPTNVHLAGWFVGSPVPGQEGVSVIDGHVNGRYVDAVFKNLGKLRPGDDMTIELGDGKIVRFEVVDNNEYSIAQTGEKMFDKVEGVNNQLTLITCGGTFNETSQTYDRRVVVRAKLAPLG